MIKRDPLLLHVMLKQGFTWFTLASNTQETVCQHRYFSRMACNLAPSCSFLYGVLSCYLPEDTIDIELTVRTLKGIHTYKKDHSTQMSSYSPWCSQVWPFPSLIKKVEVYLEERRNIKDPFHLTCMYADRHAISPCTKLQRPKRKKVKNLKNRTRAESQKVQRKSEIRRVEGHLSQSKAAISTFTLVSMPATKTATTTTTTEQDTRRCRCRRHRYGHRI